MKSGSVQFLLLCCCLSIWLVSLSSEATIAQPDTKLKYVTIIFRHGKRAPSIFFKGADPNLALFTAGPGKLLKQGKEDSYQLGKWFHERYGSLLSGYVRDDELYLRSTDKDRTLATAQLFAAGIYSPPKAEEVWNDDLGSKWQPVAVHTIPLSIDPFLDVYTLNNCPKYTQFMDILQKTPEGRRYETENKDLGDRVLNKTGQRLDKPRDFIDVIDILDVAEANHLPFPDWLSKEDVEKMFELRDYFITKYVKMPEITQLAGGYLIREIMNRFSDVVNNKSTDGLKAYSYTAHDYTLMYILSTMHVFNDIVPTFSAAVIIELHEDKKGDHYLQVHYKNDTTREPYLLNFPSCAESCPWQKVHDLTKTYFVDDLDKFKANCVAMSSKEVAKKQAEYDTKFP